MVCTANDLQEWKDFPKGLKVLLLDGDSSSAAEMRSQLEAMDYIVSTFCNENEALTEILVNPGSFHVAIVEVCPNDNQESFKFLETAKDLPTIMTSNIHCLSTMMKCIALGAVEFLQKPLSEDKLRNIWQHVVHKAFNSKGAVLSESLKPVKESVASMLQLQLENGEAENEISVDTENLSLVRENDQLSVGSDKYPAPSTPQLKQGARLLDDGDCQDQTNFSTEKENGEQDGESKSVETTCGDLITEGALQEVKPQIPGKTLIKDEEESADVCKGEKEASPHQPNTDSLGNKDGGGGGGGGGGGVDNLSKPSVNNSSGARANRKKMKVDWTPELHKKFVQAVEQLGVDQAIPSRILELMKVEGLTRHNVASHLQKYRMHKRHILRKEDDRRWPHVRDPMQRSYYPHRPVTAFPSYHPNHTLAPARIYPMWGPPASHPPPVQMWGLPGYPPWQPAENWHWNPYHGMQADAWGCPVLTTPHNPYPSFPQNASGFQHFGAVDNNSSYIPPDSYELHPAEEIIDKVVKEAISNPWQPLPLGLKPPCTDSVLSELSKQGICSIPRHVNGSHPH